MQTQSVFPRQAISLTRSTIGKKVIMAVTGLIWIGYVVVHMYGNLKVFLGAEAFDSYAEGLRTLGEPLLGHSHLLLIARLVLIISLVLHVWAAVSLYGLARRARGTRYSVYRTQQANVAALSIRYGGLAILLFILYHLMHFTWGVPGVHSDFRPGHPYHNLVVGFQSWPVVIVYLLALVALGLHLYHGTWSMFQTLGLNNRTYSRLLRLVALGLALVVSLGFAIVPLAVLFGMVS